MFNLQAFDTLVASCCAQFNWPFEMKASEVVRDVKELSKTNQNLPGWQ